MLFLTKIDTPSGSEKKSLMFIAFTRKDVKRSTINAHTTLFKKNRIIIKIGILYQKVDADCALNIYLYSYLSLQSY